MIKKISIGVIALLIIVGFLAGCGTPAAMQEPFNAEPIEAPGPQSDAAPAVEAQDQQSAAVPASGAVVYRTGSEADSSLSSPRLIIKNAQLILQVEDTDTSIDGVMQVTGDVGGYVVSSRVWFQPSGDENYKYATLTIAVPADQFEQTMRRLRGLAVRILDETSSGEDVTDQYVDLQSRLQSLQATRARILEFLNQAKTVEEALRVNNELASVEQEIEEVQGRINYLSGRSNYSTITVDLQPRIPDMTPTSTPTLEPTATPEPWNPQKTFNRAQLTLTNIYQGLADLVIWIVVVLLPVVLPFVVIGIIIWVIMKRRKNPPPPPGSGRS